MAMVLQAFCQSMARYQLPGSTRTTTCAPGAHGHWGPRRDPPILGSAMRVPSWRFILTALLGLAWLVAPAAYSPALADGYADQPPTGSVGVDKLAGVISPLQTVQSYVGAGAVTARLAAPGPTP